MKTITCAQMGGPCDTALTADTEQEMMDAGWKHMEDAHPDMVAGIKEMPKEDIDKWSANFHTTWEAAPAVDTAPEASLESSEESE